MTEFVGYAPNPYGIGRKKFPYLLTDDLSFTSGRQSRNVGESNGCIKGAPSHYQKTLIHHTSIPGKFVEAKQQPVRTSALCGLEAPIPNSYVNSVLLVLYHVQPLRKRVLSHLCKRVFCLTCELSFLFHMLQQSTSDFSCSAINFIRAFRTIPEASALGLVLNDREDDPAFQTGASSLIQNFNRFILHHMNVEMKDEKKLLQPSSVPEKAASPDCHTVLSDTGFIVQVTAGGNSTAIAPPVCSQSLTRSQCSKSLVDSFEVQPSAQCIRGTEDLFATSVENVTQCRCGYQSSRADLYFVCTLSYPHSDEQLLKRISFERLLEYSFHLEQVKHAWCEQCSKFRISTHRRGVRSLPDVLSINCNIDNDKLRSFWRRQQQLCLEPKHPSRAAKSNAPCDELFEDNVNVSNPFGRLSWLPFNLTIRLNPDGKVAVCDQPLVGSHVGSMSNSVSYELQAVISYIRSGTVGHWVACIKALSSEVIRRSRWYLINDTQVKEIIPLEAVNFDVDWKLPCILLYSRPNLNELHPCPEYCPINDQVFTLDTVISERPSNIPIAPRQPAYFPGRGDIVAMDAEFVTLNHEEAEIRSDGSKLTFKPSQLSLARVTCVYGSGPLKGNTLLDDYICTREEISDYVTKFSGIKPGDLDPTFAERPLIAMKVAYLKLRYLIDAGVKFVGHGLSNDFKVINIYVPKEQIIDTVQLFRLPRRRLVSLRFLIWHFFGIRIQSETHDSDEDARSALMLYEKYTEIVQNSELQFSHILNELYEHGQQLRWNVPAECLKS
uniref:USP domain-containing protein n=1 Tax=Trichuris muris TaxID=70415 RepID=A0A5S6QLC5_TRIMR